MRLFPLCNGYMICLVACIGVLLAAVYCSRGLRCAAGSGAGVLDWCFYHLPRTPLYAGEVTLTGTRQPRHAEAVWCPAPGPNCLMPSRRTAKGHADQVIRCRRCAASACPGLGSSRLPYVSAGSAVVLRHGCTADRETVIG